ncbi:MAG: hypothetical protein OXH07_01010 [Chloroflexi bacterium]|nr:hypothetical protein [Chloroflexota bacterium]
MRSLALAAAATFVISALACGGGETAPDPTAAPAAISGPQVFFVQIDT